MFTVENFFDSNNTPNKITIPSMPSRIFTINDANIDITAASTSEPIVKSTIMRTISQVIKEKIYLLESNIGRAVITFP